MPAVMGPPVAPVGPPAVGLASVVPMGPMSLTVPGPPPLAGPLPLDPDEAAARDAERLYADYQAMGDAKPMSAIPSPMLNPGRIQVADPLVARSSRWGNVSTGPEAGTGGAPPAGAGAAAPGGAGGGAGSMQLSQPRYVPPGYDAKRNPWRGEGQKRFFEADSREKTALDEQAKVVAGDQLRSAAVLGELQDQVEGQEAERRQREALRVDQAREAEAKTMSLIEDIQSSKMDPTRFYSSMGVAAKASALIASALQGAASGLMGRSDNSALSRYDALAQQDLDSQRTDLAAKQSALSGRQNLLQQMRARFGDERMAEKATLLSFYEGAKLKTQQMASASGSELTMKKAEGVLAELDKKTELLKRELVDIPSYRPGQMVGGRGGLSEKDQARYVPAAGGLARTPEEATKLRTAAGSVDNIKAMVKEARALRNDPKAFIPGTDANARLKSIGAGLKLEGKTSFGLGALAEMDVNLLDELSGSVTSPLPGVNAQLEAMGSRAQQGLQRSFQNQGIQQVQTGYGADPTTGQLKPKAEYTGKDTKPMKGFKAVGE